MLKSNLKRIFTGLLAMQALLIVTGGAVRLTGSGLGCPTWPTCTGNSYRPVPHQAQGQLHAWIEFGNRLVAWLILIFALLGILGIQKYLKNRPDFIYLRRLAGYQLLGFIAQVILGGITVLTKLNPISVSGHFLLSIPLIAGALSLRNYYLHKDRFQVGATTKLLEKIFLFSVILLIIVGTIVTGSGPLAGDISAKRYKFDQVKVADLHSYIAILVVALVIALLQSVRRSENEGARRNVTKSIYLILFILLIQGVIGYSQFALGLPELLVGSHLLGAALLWICTWNLHLQMRDR
jgi:heme a synthase